jgi:HEAT repeat protein
VTNLKSTLRSTRLACLALVVWGGSAAAHGGIRPDYEMERDPEIRAPADIKEFSNRLKLLWVEALARPEADMQRMAADAIGRGHTAGIPGMDEAVPRLVEILALPASHPAARLAAARTLVALDAKQAAPQMSECAPRFGADLRQIVEPALAGWNFESYDDVWRARLKAPGTHHRDLVLAIRCLATAQDAAAVAPLLEIIHDRFRTAAVRSEAALAAGLIAEKDLESDAGRLIAGLADAAKIDRLCGVRLLTRHAGDDAQNLLARFAVDPEPAVAVIALSRLITIDPHLVLPLAEGAMRSADPLVRQRGADAYVLLPDPGRVAVLARLLDDPHPAVRGSVRDSLFDLAQRSELDEPIRQAATEMLAGQSWRGLEQAALLLGALDHKPASARLVELLESPRPEVGIAAAWGLKQLAVPETLPAMFDKSNRQTELRSKDGFTPAGLDEQTAHLFEAFGKLRYAAAEPLLRRYVPKDYKMGEYSRAALRSGCWDCCTPGDPTKSWRRN